MADGGKVVTAITIKSDAPFTIEIQPREGYTPLFQIGDDTYDTEWIQPLIDLLEEAKKVAKKFSPPSGKK